MIRRLFVVLILVFGLTACQTPDPKPHYPDITFSHLAPINLDVGAVDYKQAHAPPGKMPHVEHFLPRRLSTIARRWADERIKAVGPVSRIARITLVYASVVGTPLKITQGIQGIFTTDQAIRYDATVKIRIEIVNGRGVVEGWTEAIAHHAQTAAENITLNERDQLWFELIEAVMRDLDQEMETTIRKYLMKYIR